jgi:predicted  nucleic acid-binding Zn-ribbon protein
MDLSKLELLESRINKVVQMLVKLKEDNTFLENQVQALQHEIAKKDEEINRLRQENEFLANQEEEFKQLSRERTIIKDRLEGMLETLNQLNID